MAFNVITVKGKFCGMAIVWDLNKFRYLEYFAINGGWEMFFAMWTAGIPYDLTHCAGNFVFTLALYKPLYRVMEALLQQQKTGM